MLLFCYVCKNQVSWRRLSWIEIYTICTFYLAIIILYSSFFISINIYYIIHLYILIYVIYCNHSVLHVILTLFNT